MEPQQITEFIRAICRKDVSKLYTPLFSDFFNAHAALETASALYSTGNAIFFPHFSKIASNFLLRPDLGNELKQIQDVIFSSVDTKSLFNYIVKNKQFKTDLEKSIRLFGYEPPLDAALLHAIFKKEQTLGFGSLDKAGSFILLHRIHSILEAIDDDSTLDFATWTYFDSNYSFPKNVDDFIVTLGLTLVTQHGHEWDIHSALSIWKHLTTQLGLFTTASPSRKTVFKFYSDLLKLAERATRLSNKDFAREILSKVRLPRNSSEMDGYWSYSIKRVTEYLDGKKHRAPIVSSLRQANNALRNGLIDRKRYDDLISRFKKRNQSNETLLLDTSAIPFGRPPKALNQMSSETKRILHDNLHLVGKEPWLTEYFRATVQEEILQSILERPDETDFSKLTEQYEQVGMRPNAWSDLQFRRFLIFLSKMDASTRASRLKILNSISRNFAGKAPKRSGITIVVDFLDGFRRQKAEDRLELHSFYQFADLMYSDDEDFLKSVGDSRSKKFDLKVARDDYELVKEFEQSKLYKQAERIDKNDRSKCIVVFTDLLKELFSLKDRLKIQNRQLLKVEKWIVALASAFSKESRFADALVVIEQYEKVAFEFDPKKNSRGYAITNKKYSLQDKFKKVEQAEKKRITKETARLKTAAKKARIKK